ncbi:hypothetical protein PTSG_03166 [Salpingoeca rosetta]|uniref:Acylamino-acid-releasing enzyme n=1 Tax=Salpingoeca rosetta (strain ATCC 50818 / BSB-021) TaxID=946362 RepID=F2U4F0_SALR5|nr:uncharacterized protein PTSG_03166 [Salpingoeca rosetta]EGD82516.1 hypothetical protein PTSG_03166 [Salpingoeca rosetta]|eukprot:XP_004995752.1 hypothetical protein PTSG_03166 [Salpingoeca rosetta]
MAMAAKAIQEWYRRAEVPTVKGGSFTSEWAAAASKDSGSSPLVDTVEVVLGHNIPDAQEKRTYRRTLTVVRGADGTSVDTVVRSAAVDTTGVSEHVRVLAASKKFAFTASNPAEGGSSNGNGNGGGARVNIVGRNGCLATADCKKLHGKVLPLDNTFGGAAFTDDEETVYYVAVTNPPKETTWWGPKAEDNDEKKEGEEKHTLSTKYETRDNWGEAHVGIGETAIFRWQWQTPGTKPEKVNVQLPTTDSSNKKTLGEVAVRGQRMAFVAWDNGKGRPLGAQYCINRNTAVYVADLDGSNVKQISDDGVHSCLAPRFSPDGARVVWMQTNADGPHRRASAVVAHTFDTGANTTLVPPTVYIGKLPYNCWLSSTEFVFSHLTRSQIVVSYVDCATSTHAIVPMTKETVGAWSVQDVCGRNVLVSFTCPSTPRGLFVFSFAPASSDVTPLTLIEPRDSTGLRFSRYETAAGDQDVLVLLPPLEEEPETKALHPTILVPHGGPHSAVPLDYFALYAAFAYGGYAIVFPNYRGSLGFTEDTLESLPGKAGTQDVEDVVALCDLAYKNEPSLDPARLFVFGGSHGGFLTAHLTAQYPDKFVAAAMRNPVTDIAAMVHVTDIPDWCFVEAGLPIKPIASITAEDMAAMKKASPLPFVHRVKSPTLVLIGDKDLRVPPFQGRLWYYGLRENGVETKLFTYPDDSHPLASIACASDVFVNVALWFGRFR